MSLSRHWSWSKTASAQVLVASLAVAPGCTTDARRGEPTAQSRSAITGAANDPTTPANNVVVALEVNLNPGCGSISSGSSVLITPTLVLTANHVVNCTSPHDVMLVVPGGGPDRWLSNNTHYDTGAFANNIFLFPTTGDADDLALVELNEADFAKTINGKTSGSAFDNHYQEFLENAIIVRPSFSVPPHTGPDDAPVFAPNAVAFAGWDHTTNRPRQVAGIDTLTNTGLWTFQSPTIVAETGDSGGPLFFTRPSSDPSFPSTRDPFGIEVSVQGDASSKQTHFVDLTQSFVLPWLMPLVVDHTHDNQPKWLCQHPSPFGVGAHCDDPSENQHWKGEVDYTGPCDKEGDRDCDHWLNTHDNCPFAVNVDQTDSNDDGIGDACQTASSCPCDPGNDADGDGVCGACDATVSAVCGQVCGTTQFLDNCPFAYNPNQENCNLLAEQAVNGRTGKANVPGQTILGDMCDPVPCPQGDADTSTGRTTPQCCPNPGGQGQQCYLRKFHDAVTLTPIGAHPLGNHLAKGQADNVVPVPALFGSTEARYCQSAPSAGFDCRSTTAADQGGRGVVDSRQLNFWPNADAELGNDPLHPWHRTTLGQLTLTVPTSCEGTRGAPEIVSYAPGTTVTDTWCYEDDWSYWLTGLNSPKIPVTGTACQNVSQCAGQPVPGTCLVGTLWRHSNMEVGHNIDSVGNSFVGLHPSPADQNIADHYFDVQPDQGMGYCPVASPLIVGDPPNPQPLPQPRMLWQAQSAYRASDLRSVAETDLLVPSALGTIVTVLDDGSGVAVGDNGGSCVGHAATSGFTAVFAGGRPLVWASAVEPSAKLGVVSGDVMAVALAADGSALIDGAVASGDVLHSATELGGAGLALGAAAGDTPSPRSGFSAVFSRSAGGVYVIGGSDVQSGAALHDVRFLPLGGFWTHPVYADYEPASVLGATFSFADRKLWVLDKIDSAREHERLRLARLDPYGGQVQVVGTWRLKHAEAAFFLSIGRDGSVLLSVTRGHHHAVVLFDASDEDPHAALVGRHSGALALAPIADDHSYAFVVWAKSGTELRIRRRADIGGCDPDEDDCDSRRTVDHGDLDALF
jgi:hypothetical protein